MYMQHTDLEYFQLSALPQAALRVKGGPLKYKKEQSDMGSTGTAEIFTVRGPLSTFNNINIRLPATCQIYI